jgi:hypothetical protein
MPRPGRLIACPECACHVQPTESRCPHCGAVVRQADGSVARTAAAVLLGLTTAVAGCGGEVVQPVYGTPTTGGSGGGGAGAGGTTQTTSTASTGGTGGGFAGAGGVTGGGGTGGTTGGGGTGGDTSQPVYGAPPM